MRRWLWRLLFGLWLVPGGLFLFMTFVVWKGNPSDDVDYEPMARLFYGALLAWVALGVTMLVCWLLYRAAKQEAAEVSRL